MSHTDPPLSVPDDDALDAAATAVVDGVATQDEAALVAASPDGQARVAALRAVADAVRRPVPDQDRAAAAQARAAALDAFAAASGAVSGAGAGVGDSAAADGGAAPSSGAGVGGPPPVGDGASPSTGPAGSGNRRPATVTPLLPRPASATAARWLPRLSLVAAALFLLVGLGAVAVGVLGNNGSDRQTSAAEVAVGPSTTVSAERLAAPAAPAAPGAAAGAKADAAAPQATTAFAAAPSTTIRPPAMAPATGRPTAPVVDGGDVGSQGDVQALAQRAAAALDSPPDPATAAAGSALPSDVQACVRTAPTSAGQPVGDLRYRAVGTFQGTPAVVLAYDRPGSPARLLLVLARQGCTLLASTPF